MNRSFRFQGTKPRGLGLDFSLEVCWNGGSSLFSTGALKNFNPQLLIFDVEQGSSSL